MVVIIALGLLLLVAGETEFDLVGFLVVMGASMLAGFRWTITQVLLQGDRHHGAICNHCRVAAKTSAGCPLTKYGKDVVICAARVDKRAGPSVTFLLWLQVVPAALCMCCTI